MSPDVCWSVLITVHGSPIIFRCTSISRTYLCLLLREWINQGKRPPINFPQLYDSPKCDHSDSKNVQGTSQSQIIPFPVGQETGNGIILAYLSTKMTTLIK